MFSKSFHPQPIPHTICSAECFVTLYVNLHASHMHKHNVQNCVCTSYTGIPAHSSSCSSYLLVCELASSSMSSVFLEVCVPLNMCVDVLVWVMCLAPADGSAVSHLTRCVNSGWLIMSLDEPVCCKVHLLSSTWRSHCTVCTVGILCLSAYKLCSFKFL